MPSRLPQKGCENSGGEELCKDETTTTRVNFRPPEEGTKFKQMTFH